ncbi:MAG TPA: DUF2934 domain-containing protein [Bryobacteraceae bacterium]|jgi:hypothetical protein
MLSAGPAPARSRRTSTARTQHVAAAAEVPASPVRNPETPVRADAVVSDRELSHQDIARLAYALWEARGGEGGSPEEDWLRAEQELRRNPAIS